MIATTATEILDFIAAETMIAGQEISFVTRAKITHREVTITGSEMAKRVLNSVANDTSVREGVSLDGRMTIEIHDGDSVFGRYTLV